jgi:hypothetical protein
LKRGESSRSPRHAATVPRFWPRTSRSSGRAPTCRIAAEDVGRLARAARGLHLPERPCFRRQARGRRHVQAPRSHAGSKGRASLCGREHRGRDRGALGAVALPRLRAGPREVRGSLGLVAAATSGPKRLAVGHSVFLLDAPPWVGMWPPASRLSLSAEGARECGDSCRKCSKLPTVGRSRAAMIGGRPAPRRERWAPWLASPPRTRDPRGTCRRLTSTSTYGPRSWSRCFPHAVTLRSFAAGSSSSRTRVPSRSTSTSTASNAG